MNRPDFAGPATLFTAGTEYQVTAALSGHLDPIDGRFHWYGRVTADKLPRPGRAEARLTIATTAPVRLDETDPWGNLRVSGTGAPPY